MPEQDPRRVVCLVETNGPPEVGNGLVVVSTQTVEVACMQGVDGSYVKSPEEA